MSRFADLAQILHVHLARGSNHEMNILRLKFILRRTDYGSRPFGAPPGHGNEANQEQLLHALASFAFSFLYLFLL